MLKQSKITICTAFHHDRLYRSESIINLNYKLAHDVNSNFSWMAAVSKGNYQGGLDKRFRIIESPHKLQECPGDVKKIHDKYHINETPSCDHGFQLNHLVPKINTRYVLFLDPDYFIIPPLDNIIKHMSIHDIEFFGCFYHPDVIDPPQSTVYDEHGQLDVFPCPWCCMIDLNTIDNLELDFLPGFIEKAEDIKHIPYPISGSKVILKFRSHKSECVIPSVRRENMKKIRDQSGDLLVNNIHYTNKTFSDLGLKQSSYEEYFWKTLPFAIHTRTRTVIKHHRPIQLKKPRKLNRRIARQKKLNVELRNITQIIKQCRKYNDRSV